MKGSGIFGRAARAIAVLFAVLAVSVAFVFVLDRVAGLPDNSDRSHSERVTADTGSRIERGIEPRMAAHPGETGLYELRRGLDAFAARVVLLREAEHSIDTQYYMWHQDVVGRFLAYPVSRFSAPADESDLEQPMIARQAAESFVANIRSVAFEVRLVGEEGGSKSLQWQGLEDGQVVSLTSEPYVGFGTRTAVTFMRLFPVNWLL